MKIFLPVLILMSSVSFASGSKVHVKLCEFAAQEYPGYVTVDSCLDESQLRVDHDGNPEITLLICGNVGEYVTFTDYGPEGIFYGGSGASDECE